MRDFPDDFLWGSATAAHQVEGGNVNNRPRFGLIAVGDDFSRTPKPSAHAFARVARSGRLDALFERDD